MKTATHKSGGLVLRSSQSEAGFSLIEILVAMTILVIIVLTMGSIFHQSTVAWDSGMRKAEGNMSARAVLGIISREMSEAVAYTGELQGNIAAGPAGSVTFVTLGGETKPGMRVARRVTFGRGMTPNTIMRVEETMTEAGGPGGYGAWSGTTNEVVLATNVYNNQLFFEAPPQFSAYTTNLPKWVKVRVALRRTDDVSGVVARSFGPDRQDDHGRDDDLAAW